MKKMVFVSFMLVLLVNTVFASLSVRETINEAGNFHDIIIETQNTTPESVPIATVTFTNAVTGLQIVIPNWTNVKHVMGTRFRMIMPVLDYLDFTQGTLTISLRDNVGQIGEVTYPVNFDGANATPRKIILQEAAPAGA